MDFVYPDAPTARTRNWVHVEVYAHMEQSMEESSAKQVRDSKTTAEQLE
jgi:hypothetical protein